MEENINKKEEIHPTSIKMPIGLLEKIRKNAKKNKRSVTQEVIYTLEKYYEIRES